MPFNCGISVLPIQTRGREVREYNTTTACKIRGVCSGEGTVIPQHGEEGLSSHTGKSSLCCRNTTRTEVPPVLRVLWACEPLLCVLQPCTSSSSQLGPPHHVVLPPNTLRRKPWPCVVTEQKAKKT